MIAPRSVLMWLILCAGVWYIVGALMHFSPQTLTAPLLLNTTKLTPDQLLRYSHYFGYLCYVMGTIGLVCVNRKQWRGVKGVMRLYNLFFSLFVAGILVLKLMVIKSLTWSVAMPYMLIPLVLSVMSNYYILKTEALYNEQ